MVVRYFIVLRLGIREYSKMYMTGIRDYITAHINKIKTILQVFSFFYAYF